MLGIVYFTLVYIIRQGGRGPEFLAHLMLSLFAFRLVSTSVSSGARSVVGGGRLILNTAFPRLLLPLESVLESFMRFLPTVAVYAVVHAIVGLPIGPQLLWVLPIIALFTVFAAGAAMFAATAQVYFRDLTNFLPYFTRIWLYTSPILFYAEDVPERLRPILLLQPDVPHAGLAERRRHRGEDSAASPCSARASLGRRRHPRRHRSSSSPGSVSLRSASEKPAVTLEPAARSARPGRSRSRTSRSPTGPPSRRSRR